MEVNDASVVRRRGEVLMNIDRRNFLITAGMSGAGIALSVSAQAAGPKTITVNEPSLWKLVRSQFDQLSTEKIHLSSFFLVSHPRPVRDAIKTHRRAIDENPFEYIEQNVFAMPNRIQKSVAEYVGGKPDEIALTNSTTMGLAFVYHGLPIKAGQEILTTTHDHFVHHESIRLSAEYAGASVKKIPLYADVRSVTETEITERIRKAITQKTRVLGVTWVHSSTGLKLPIRAIANVVAEANKGRAEADRILLIVDGVHGFGVEDESVATMGADFFIAGTHKWIFGPRGTGIVWATADNWKLLRPIFPPASEANFVAWINGQKAPTQMQASWVIPGGFHAFEYEWALPAAFEFHKKIGRSNAAQRIHSLNDLCKEGLAEMRHVKLYTPLGSKLSSGLVCFEMDGIKSGDVVKRLLEKQVIASTAPYREGYVRLAPSLLNTPEEIETTLGHIRSLT